jgi:hypothetical protein
VLDASSAEMDIEDSGHLKENEDLRDLKDALRAQVAQPVAGAVEVSRSGRRPQSAASAVSSPSIIAFSSVLSLDSKATSAPPLDVSPFILQLSAPSAGAPATKTTPRPPQDAVTVVPQAKCGF